LDRRFSLAAMAFKIMGLPPSGKRQIRLACLTNRQRRKFATGPSRQVWPSPLPAM